MKSKDDRYVNRVAKKLNKQLREDVFKDRFYCRQLRKTKESWYDVAHYLYAVFDKEDPTRVEYVGWVNRYDCSYRLFRTMNDFIIESDFWEKYRNKG